MFDLTKSAAKPLDLNNAIAPCWELTETDDIADSRQNGDSWGASRAAEWFYATQDCIGPMTLD